MLASLVSKKLGALQYPAKDSFSLTDRSNVETLVLWLENRKIREYPPEGRKGLSTSDGWDEHFKLYLKELVGRDFCSVVLPWRRFAHVLCFPSNLASHYSRNARCHTMVRMAPWPNVATGFLPTQSVWNITTTPIALRRRSGNPPLHQPQVRLL